MSDFAFFVNDNKLKNDFQRKKHVTSIKLHGKNILVHCNYKNVQLKSCLVKKLPKYFYIDLYIDQ